MNWIKCSTRVPDPYIDVLVFEKCGHLESFKIGHRLNREEYDWVDDHLYQIYKPLYWMELPATPE
jgi:hypothetical protein